jgi:very-short-patch-repair endonuclease
MLAGLGGEPQGVIGKRRVDLLFRRPGLVLERDTEATHGGPVNRANDLDRDVELHRFGLVVEHIDDEDMLAPDAVRARVIAWIAALGDRPHALR